MICVGGNGSERSTVEERVGTTREDFQREKRRGWRSRITMSIERVGNAEIEVHSVNREISNAGGQTLQFWWNGRNILPGTTDSLYVQVETHGAATSTLRAAEISNADAGWKRPYAAAYPTSSDCQTPSEGWIQRKGRQPIRGDVALVGEWRCRFFTGGGRHPCTSSVQKSGRQHGKVGAAMTRARHSLPVSARRGWDVIPHNQHR